MLASAIHGFADAWATRVKKKRNTETGFLVFANDGRNGTLARSHDPGGTKQVAGIGMTNTELTATTLVAWTQTMQKQIAIAAYGLH